MSNIQNSGWMNTADFCLQRQRRFLLNKPPPRLDSMAANPYLQGFSQAQLDMRRKAEVLKYSAVSTNSKTNNLTKAEKYAQMARFAKGGGSYDRIKKIQETCQQDELIKTPNYSCDVPGPYTLLYLDETVELYNYGKGNTTGAIENPTNKKDPYTSESYDNVASADNVALNTANTISNVYDKSIPVASLYIKSSESNQEYNYQIPVLFEFTNENGLTDTTPVTVTVERLLFYMYYNKTLVSTNDQTIPFTPVSNISIPQVVFDTFNTTSFEIRPPSTTFSGHVYLGTVDIQHLQICNQPNTIYDIRIMIVYTTNPGNIIRYKTVANTSYREVFYSSPGMIWFDETLFESAHISGTSKTTQLYTSLIEPENQILNIATQGTYETITVGNETTTVVLNGEIWWDSPSAFPQSGFINQLVQ